MGRIDTKDFCPCKLPVNASEETMRRNFARLQGVSPQDYRERFGGG